MTVATATQPVSTAADGRGVLGYIERTIGLTLSGLVVIGLVVIGWILAHSLGGRALYLAAYAGVAVLGVAVYIARRRRPVHAVRSDIARRTRVGQTLEIEVTLSSPSRVATFELEETLHPHLGRTVRVPVAAVGPGRDFVHHYSISPRLRGVYEVGPLTAEFTDPMGLARRRQVLVKPTEVIVHPQVEEVLDRPLTRAFEDPPLRPPRSRAWPEGFEFYGMRDYVPGDDMRRVVWRAFARTEKMMVREFEQGISDRIAVVVDTDESWHSPGTPSDTFETAVRVAASVGVRHIKDGFSVRLESGYSQLGRVFRGPRARLPFLDELARVHLGREPLTEAMGRLAGGRRRDAHVVVITSNFSAAAAARAQILLNDSASLTVCAIVWEESEPTSIRRAAEIGAQVVQVKQASSLTGVFRASLQTKTRL